MKNENAIISSLECCMGCACLSCAYNEFEAGECKDELIHDALMLVNRLTREKNKISKGEYISREALLEDIQAAEDHGGMGSLVAGTLKRYVKRVPAADVAPKSEGEWVRKDGFLVCSNCDSTKPFAVIRDEIHYFGCNYCNKCGAKMKGGTE